VDLLIKNGAVVVGDGRQVLEPAHILVENGKIAEVCRGDIHVPEEFRQVLDAEGKMVLPGIINHHTHGCTLGPLFPSAARPLDENKARDNLLRHLSQGTTTLFDVSGFSVFSDIESFKNIPVDIKLTTAHTQANIKAALAVDGSGLTQRHKETSMEQMLARGAVAIGEIGGGHTLGGGGQDYLYIPRAIKKATGVTISTADARRLKFAVLGRYIEHESFDCGQTQKVLSGTGLSGKIDIEEIRKLVEKSVMPSMKPALEGFHEAAKGALKYRKPVIFHNSAPSVKTIYDILKKYANSIKIIAAHSNHDTFLPQELLQWAKKLKDAGAVIDIATFDITSWSREHTGGSEEYFDTMAQSGLADIISTDYNGGFWDSILTGIKRMIDKGYSDLPRAVAMATGRVADIFGLTSKGYIQKGKDADIIIIDKHDISRVECVIAGGKIVANETSPCHPCHQKF